MSRNFGDTLLLVLDVFGRTIDPVERCPPPSPTPSTPPSYLGVLRTLNSDVKGGREPSHKSEDQSHWEIYDLPVF